MYQIFFIQSAIKGHFGCFHVFITVNTTTTEKKAIHIFANKCFQIFQVIARRGGCCVIW